MAARGIVPSSVERFRLSASRVRPTLLAVAISMLGIGCYSTGEGPEPRPNALYFPVGILPSPGGNALYVVNSDFDLQFNGGTVEAYNLQEIRDVALRPFWAPDPSDDGSDPCFGLGGNPNVILYPGPCGPLDFSHLPPRSVPYGPVFKSSVKIGAFATDVVMACHPSEDLTLGTADCMRGGVADPRGARLFVPVRGDRSLTFFDVDDDRLGGEQTFKLECGQGTNNGRCSDTFRAGIDPGENTRGLTLPAEPFGIAVSDRGDSIVMTHQSSTSGSVSLFTGRDATKGTVLGAKPRLEHVLSGLPGSATGVAAVPTPAIDAALGFEATNYQPGFAVAYRLVAEIDMLRFFDDAFAAPERPFLQRTARFGLPPTPSGADSRDITIDASPSSERSVCERACRDGGRDLDCFRKCTHIPLGVYVSNRSPGALLIGEMRLSDETGSNESLFFYDSVPLAAGSSRVVIGRIHDRRDPPGQFRPRVFVVCFDARTVIVYDPVERRVDGLIRTGRGPHAFVMDPIYPIAYLGHFTDSYIGLVDLDQSHPSTFETIVATIGIPVAPQGTK
jgi:DNA-binding beta-propeller fold protein YncE